MFPNSNFRIRTKKTNVPYELNKCKTQKLMIISFVACILYELDEKNIKIL